MVAVEVAYYQQRERGVRLGSGLNVLEDSAEVD
jgi:hypothetical protein